MVELDREWFARDTLEVARDLVGTVVSVGRCSGRIVETEAYTTDAASHAVTRRQQSAAMRETYGHIYVFLIYGMHYCLNFTTERDAVGAVIIRAAEPLTGLATMARRRGTDNIKQLCSGPGKLCQALGIDLRMNGLAIGGKLKVYAAEHVPVVATSRRIGISQAQELEWRYYEQGNPFVSRG